MDIESPLFKGGFVFVTALGGALTSLYSQQWQKMDRMEIVFSLIVAMSFSLFAFPWIAAQWFGWEFGTTQAAGAVSYIGATASHIVIPRLIMKLRRQFGEEVSK